MWYSRFAEAYPGFSIIPSYPKLRPIAYGYNPNIHNSRWMGRIVAIPKPSEIVIMGEMNDDSRVDPSQKPVTVGNVLTRYRVNRSGRALYLFCDGRVASLEGDQSESALQTAGKTNIWRWW